ncbi:MULTISPECIES: carbohydrate ABC transporter permease [Paenibacillus]|uniref:Sugar ABC transporter permease n=1 Tax=Paenibacillus lignilyticus TaxID=1172615 RepID=A0ABS5CJ48_9BACL|nr:MULTISPECIES: sugar ABC transporter permease [Paenibacillus]MBP3965899.1 sugar ABC transporter permease [Paenibacillus lignilyticus]SFS45310.1 multiple sugar transport system permease protein/raffinose/stachyose/melibiose transport system permease protein [Paenibacillus sp. BC26]
MNSLKRSIRSEMWYVLFILPGLCLFAFAVIVPLVIGAKYSFTDWDGVAPTAKYIGWDNYAQALRDPDLWAALRNTFKYAILVTLLVNLVSLLLAVLLDSYLKFRKVFRTIFFLPVAISTVLSAYIWSYNYSNGLPKLLSYFGIDMTSPLGNPDHAMTALIVISLWQGIGSPMIIYIAGLQGIPGELTESARIDGAGAFGAFRHITLPLLAPSVTINLLLVLTGSLKVFDLVFLTTGGGPAFSTEVISTFIYNVSFNSAKAGYGTALSMLFFLILVIVTIVQLAIFRRREVDM